jgi:radical SAM protein with 4Fe4S-binding SPASM domain
VIRNIHLLLAAGIRVSLRLNVDENNLQEIYRLIDYLKAEFTEDERKGLHVYAHSLFRQPGEELDVCPASMGPDALEAQVLKINEYILQKKLAFRDLNPLFNLKSHFCMVTAPECNVLIDASGKLFACEAMPEDMQYGNVKTGIDTDAWNRVASRCSVREECRKCLFLPECTEFDRCPNRAAYDDCFKQEKRMLEGELSHVYRLFREQQLQKKEAEDNAAEMAEAKEVKPAEQEEKLYVSD